MAATVRELRILNPYKIDAILKKEIVPSSNSSSTAFLLCTKSTSAIEAATVPVTLLNSATIIIILSINRKV